MREIAETFATALIVTTVIELVYMYCITSACGRSKGAGFLTDESLSNGDFSTDNFHRFLD